MLATILALLAPTAAADIEGRWTNPSGSVTVAIAACGDKVCGTVTAASDKAKADARKGGTTQLIGTVLLSNFTPKGNGRWSGRLFVPDLNVRAVAKLEPAGADQLKVSGCGPSGIICKSQLWTRAGE